METSPTPFAIGALSQDTGCQIETIRYYERVGLLPAPARSPGGYRLYGAKHLKRLTFIRRARALGFSLDEVRRLLALADERPRPCAEARVVARTHLADVRAKLADLHTMERVLAKTVARCAAGKGSECPLIEALSEGAGPEDAARALRGSAVSRRSRDPGAVFSGRSRREAPAPSSRKDGR